MRHPGTPVDADPAFLAAAFEASSDCIALLDAAGAIVLLNGAGAVGFGHGDRIEALGRNWLTLWQDEDGPAAHEAMRTATGGLSANFRGRLATEARRVWQTRLEPLGSFGLPAGHVLAISRDVTDQHEAKKALERSHGLQRALIDATSEIVWHVDKRTGMTTRRGYLEFTGRADSATDMDGWLELVHVDDRDHAKAIADQADLAGQPMLIEYRLLDKDGEWRWVVDRAMPIRDAAGEITDWVGIVTDIHDRKIIEQALRKNVNHLKLAVEATGLGTWDVDIGTNERDWSPEMFDLMRLPRGTKPERRHFIDSIHPDDRLRVDRELKTSGSSDENAKVSVFRLRFESGEERWIEAYERTFFDTDKQPIRRVGAMQDITARKKAEQAIWLSAHTDALTGIANRALFQSRLDEAVSQGAEADRAVALILVDLDRFKDVNDTLGHDAGDLMLRTIAERLTRQAPATATVARLGGDEFGIIVPVTADTMPLDQLATALIAAIGVPLPYQGREVDCATSIGWSVFPEQARQSSDLLKNADLALYAAKSGGRNRAVVFAPAMQLELERRLAILRHARDALGRHAIMPFYQPKVCLRTGRVVGFEALLRWTDAAGLHTPADLWEAFDDPELSLRLGARMLTLSLRDATAWNAAALPFGHVALNVASPEFGGGGLSARWLEAIEEARLPPGTIEMEVTERVLLDGNMGGIEATLQNLNAAGISIALDDFGTGYASLTHLTKFPVSWVKIDRSFTSQLECDPSAATVIRAVVSLAHGLGIKVVAEGVENRFQLGFLQDVGCDLAQGFLIAKPMSGSRVPQFLQSWPSRAAKVFGWRDPAFRQGAKMRA